MIIDRHDSIMLQGYRKALLDISHYIDNHYHALSQERIMKVDVVKSLFDCMYEEAEDMYFYGDFDRATLLLTPAKDKNGKKQKRKFILKRE